MGCIILFLLLFCIAVCLSFFFWYARAASNSLASRDSRQQRCRKASTVEKQRMHGRENEVPCRTFYIFSASGIPQHHGTNAGKHLHFFDDLFFTLKFCCMYSGKNPRHEGIAPSNKIILSSDAKHFDFRRSESERGISVQVENFRRQSITYNPWSERTRTGATANHALSMHLMQSCSVLLASYPKNLDAHKRRPLSSFLTLIQQHIIHCRPHHYYFSLVVYT